MKYLKHILLIILVIVPVIFVIGYFKGSELPQDDAAFDLKWEKEGPYVFFKPDSILEVNYIEKSDDDQLSLHQKKYALGTKIKAICYFPLDSTAFEFTIETDFTIPKSTYNDSHKVLAISDIESNYKTFRDFLIHNAVIDHQLNWTFDDGHLVLVGDFVDRGISTTQVLWFIYKLEQDAKKQGGTVHFILGNHELKNMYGHFSDADPKYNHVAVLLQKKQSNLYDTNSFIGKWLGTKNSIESINSHLFVHGGVHPDLTNSNIDLEHLNLIARQQYYKAPFPKIFGGIEQVVVSKKKGLAWYRGYFNDDLTQEEVEHSLKRFNVKSIIVGHSIQPKVNSLFNGGVIALNVQHPKDYQISASKKTSEGLLIEKGRYYRVLASGEKEAL